MHRHRTPLTGWGLLRPTVATVVRPRTTDELAAVLRSAARGRGAVARGLVKDINRYVINMQHS